jgi:integrase
VQQQVEVSAAVSSAPKYRNFFKKTPRKPANKTAKLTVTDSTAWNGDSNVQRRRFQMGSVYQNQTRTLWIGKFAEYALDIHGVEKRNRHQIVLSPVRVGEKTIGKREAQRLLQPHVDRVNFSLSSPISERKSAIFEDFATIWQRDYLSLSKPSTQSGARSTLKRLNAAFGRKDMRAIDAGDIQRFIAARMAEGLDPKTIRNYWGTVSLIWNAALAQKYVGALLPKPKLPRRAKKRARFYTLTDVAKVIAVSHGESRVFYWLAGETGLRAGEIAGLKLTDIDGERLTVNQSVWGGKEQSPKTNSAVRTLSLSPQLVDLLWEQIARQTAKGHEYLFSSSSGRPIDMNVHRRRKMTTLLKSLGIPQAGFHAFRHFNVSLLDALRVPLKTIQERVGHALTGVFTLDVYGGSPEWERNIEAGRLAGSEIERAVRKLENERDSVLVGSLSAIEEKGSGVVTS